jgi:hypothetical protein
MRQRPSPDQPGIRSRATSQLNSMRQCVAVQWNCGTKAVRPSNRTDGGGVRSWKIRPLTPEYVRFGTLTLFAVVVTGRIANEYGPRRYAHAGYCSVWSNCSFLTISPHRHLGLYRCHTQGARIEPPCASDCDEKRGVGFGSRCPVTVLLGYSAKAEFCVSSSKFT